MDKFDFNKNYARAKEVSACHNGNNTILYHPDTGREKIINPSGFLIWEKLSGANSVDDISQLLLQNYESVSYEKVFHDVCDFMNELLEHDYIEVSNGADYDRALEEYPEMADRPGDFDISLTGKCNLHCEYCFYAKEMHDRPDLSKEKWFTFFDELGRLAVRSMTLSGGEIFVRNDLFELIDHLIEKRMRYSILSNGTLINEKTLSLFEMKKRRFRLNSIQVSIDGSRPEIHDQSRGEGSFKRAISGLRLLKEAGFPVTTRVTVNRFNVDDLENIAALLLEDVGLNGFGTNDAMPMGAGCTNQASITLLPQQQLQAMKTLIRLEKKYEGRITATAGPLAKWKLYGEMEYALASREKTSKWQMGYLTACGCVFNKLAVHHDGVITPCNMLSELELGRINRNSIKTIWKTHPTLKALKDRRSIPMEKVPGCENCVWIPYCNGSCPGLAQTMTGDFNLANPHDCYKNFLAQTGLTWATVPWGKD